MASWQVQEAKNKFSELIDKAEAAPQIITRHGVEVAVVLAIKRYHALTQPTVRLGDFLRDSPLRKSGLHLERDRDQTLREVDL